MNGKNRVGAIDPRICSIHLDANALDRDGTRDGLIDRILALEEAGEINLIVQVRCAERRVIRIHQHR
jgi:hypothetical protein